MKKYEAPELYVDEFVPDTMIASGMDPGNGGAKDGNPAGNSACWGCDIVPGKEEIGPACLGPGVPGC